ncbi:MAG: hypothetical protein A2138_23785 [Deltaproteobacteria bacterium RBG_16_71_12]|nr:MAG: hypothetical protein A2138_23785 [Deltaproteobacteria bacterium RBG_16_71_12]
MILPTKHIPLGHSLFGAGAAVLRHLDAPRSVSSLWERVRLMPEIGSFPRFILVLDLLFSIDAITMVDGVMQRRAT